MRRRSLLIVAALLLAAAPPSVIAQPVSTGPEVAAISFDGVHAFGEDTLRVAIETRASECGTPLKPLCWFGLARQRQFLDEATLRADVLRLRLFYYERGYREARVGVDSVPLLLASRSARDEPASRIELRFRVEEGRPVRVASVEVEGGEDLPFIAQRPALPLEVGDAFDLRSYETGRDTLLARLRRRGYGRAEVLARYTIPADDPGRVRVGYELFPGPLVRFGEIEVVGANRVSPSLVRRMLSFGSGDLYSPQKLLESQRDLFALEVFRHAAIRADPMAVADTLVPVTVQVNEGNVHRVRVGAGMNNVECVNLEGRWTSRNFFGGARRLEVRGGVTNLLAQALSTFPCTAVGSGIFNDLSGSLAADLAQPWFFGRRNRLGAGLFIERQSLPDVFVRNAQGAYVSVGRTFGRRLNLTLAYRPELTALDAEGDEVFCVSFVLCEPEDIQAVRDPHWLAPAVLTMVLDRSNSLFSPTGGYIIRLDAETASRLTGSDFDYSRLLAEVSVYRGIGDVVLAGRLQAGTVLGAGGPGELGSLGVHPQKRFFSGGPNSVRGFAQYRLGPKVLAVDAAGVLADTGPGGAGCTALEINDGSCDASEVPAENFVVRAVGGAAALEGNIEMRFPLGPERLRGAAFLDFGQVWTEPAGFRVRDLIWTPGLGVRVYSPVGPIRVDIGYNTGDPELLRVFTTTVVVEDGELRNTNFLRSLNESVRWDPGAAFFDRLQLHFSIGQAF